MDDIAIYWNDEKNAILKEQRGIGFEDIVVALDQGQLLDDLPNPSRNFPNQRILVVEIQEYAIMVPYIEDHTGIFLKTLYPDRKATRRYVKGMNK